MYVGQHILRSLGDLADIDHRQQALKSLVGRRHKRLHESLDDRIRRARRDREGTGLTREEWARLVAACRRSSMTQAEFCGSRGIAISTLQYWSRRLRLAEDEPVPESLRARIKRRLWKLLAQIK